eukprot:CAMPEP_0172325438 /NCGR_PEP_ID=MMETSP1058-20130122/54044_1 /TAXON_ID=83371 /ORGANISM="Detonula confervacea, Strain CCMP 353" /LENGTH=55 /DNA_ID=CAMNT_0013041983 /DNA_START=248 /DNA_END=412 /DNA_ORIENTATION=+
MNGANDKQIGAGAATIDIDVNGNINVKDHQSRENTRQPPPSPRNIIASNLSSEKK